jgi:hypothetical protein
VQLDAPEVDHPCEGSGVVDDGEDGRVSAWETDELLGHVGRMLRNALLMEEVAADAVRISHHVERTAPQVRQGALGDVDVVADEVALGEPARREEGLVRVRDRNLVAAHFHRESFAADAETRDGAFSWATGRRVSA